MSFYGLEDPSSTGGPWTKFSLNEPYCPMFEGNCEARGH